MRALEAPAGVDAFDVPALIERPEDEAAMREYFRRNPLGIHREDCLGGCGGACLEVSSDGE